MMALLSGAWWLQKLSGITAQAIYIVLGVAAVIGGLAWLRHDARMDERNSWELRMEKARLAQVLIVRRKENQSFAIGNRAEKALTEERDVLALQNQKLEEKLAKLPIRTVCYPKAIIGDLNR